MLDSGRSVLREMKLAAPPGCCLVAIQTLVESRMRAFKWRKVPSLSCESTTFGLLYMSRDDSDFLWIRQARDSQALSIATLLRSRNTKHFLDFHTTTHHTHQQRKIHSHLQYQIRFRLSYHDTSHHQRKTRPHFPYHETSHRRTSGLTTVRGTMSPPQIFPLPSGAHSDCRICESNYYKVKQQQHAIPYVLSGRGEGLDDA
jgi:hypothetical protein